MAAKFDGTGFGGNKIRTNIIYSMTNSSIMGININSSGGEVKSLNKNLNLRVSANTSAGNAYVTGRVNIANMNNPVYAVKGNVSGLDISRLTRNGSDKSNINT